MDGGIGVSANDGPVCIFLPFGFILGTRVLPILEFLKCLISHHAGGFKVWIAGAIIIRFRISLFFFHSTNQNHVLNLQLSQLGIGELIISGLKKLRVEALILVRKTNKNYNG